MANRTLEIVVNPERDAAKSVRMSKDSMLVSWIMTRVTDWEDHRDSNYRSKFEEYYRLWRCIWAPSDKTRESERSRLISPATQQAIEATVAELEESTFGKGKVWFDIEDDVLDEVKDDLLTVRNTLIEDFAKADVPNEISKVFLYGAIYGTGIAKILVEQITERKMATEVRQGISGPETRATSSEVQRVQIRLEAIHPLNFVIDSAARTIDEALGVAHTVIKPTHTIIEKQRAGIYNDVDIGSMDDDQEILLNDEGTSATSGYTKIVEYHGKVPYALIADQQDMEVDLFPEGGEAGEQSLSFDVDDDDLVEAIVTIANDGVLLRAVENPFIMKDRGFVAYQHDLVPNSFWGRGVAEKGYNPQKALDADLRARMDAMALVTHPMMAIDATRIPRGQKMTVAPGKTYLTNGNPAEVFMPFKFGNLDPNSFAQTADLERMIQVATGAVDTAAPIGINARNATASGMSMMTAATLKRQKRAKQNIDRQFLDKFIEKALWRYMQLEPTRYPAADYKFVVKSSIGLMAREYEQAQMTQLLSVIPQDSPMFAIILKGIIDNSSTDNKAELQQALVQWQQPDPTQQQIQQMLQQLQIENAQLTNMKLKSEAAENFAQAQMYGDKNQTDSFNAITNRMTAMTNAAKEKQQGGQRNE